MYAQFYGLRELPFNITPDPRFLYLNDCYQEALAALGYGIDGRRGFISLVGEAGTGKTTLLRRLLDTLAPNTKTVLLLNPTVTFDEILEHILLELGVPCEGGRKLVLLQRLNEFLLEHTRAGGNVALLIDEAQDLHPSVLEELRLLSNLETAREKILQIVLAGQPELDAIFADRALRQLRQRITLRIRIRPLSVAEVSAYIRSRLACAGRTTDDLFTVDALARVADVTRGIPRIVNVLCDAALLAAYAAGSRQVTPALVEDAWRDYSTDAYVPEPPVRAAIPSPPPPAEPIPMTSPAPAAEPVLPPVTFAPPAPPPPTPPPHAPIAIPAAPSPPPELREPPGPVAAGSTFSVPMAAGLVLVLAVTLSVVSLRQRWSDPDAMDDPSPPLAAAPSDGPGLGGPVDATAAEPPAAPIDRPPTRTVALPVVAPDSPLTPSEATTVIDEFRTAYEARDVDRLLQLFSADASQNGVRGVDAIGSTYRESLPTLNDVRYTMASFSVEPHGPRADVRGPFTITYRTASGASGEIRGHVEWELERREGRTSIVSLNYRLEG